MNKSNTSNEFRGYLLLSERVILECSIKTKEPLHVGAGKEDIEIREIDQPIVLNKNGKPIIPGSTIKGFLRNFIASLLLAHKSQLEKLNINIGSVKIEIPLDKINEKYILNPLNILIDKVLPDELSPLEYVFGAPNFASLIKVSEAETAENILIGYRTHVSIDQAKGKAREWALVSVEYVPKGTEFKFNIHYDKLDDPILDDANKLFLLLAKILMDGYEDFIGGWKSRGYGLVKIKCSEIKRIKIRDLKTLKSYEEIDLETLAKEWLQGEKV